MEYCWDAPAVNADPNLSSKDAISLEFFESLSVKRDGTDHQSDNMHDVSDHNHNSSNANANANANAMRRERASSGDDSNFGRPPASDYSRNQRHSSSGNIVRETSCFDKPSSAEYGSAFGGYNENSASSSNGANDNDYRFSHNTYTHAAANSIDIDFFESLSSREPPARESKNPPATSSSNKPDAIHGCADDKNEGDSKFGHPPANHRRGQHTNASIPETDYSDKPSSTQHGSGKTCSPNNNGLAALDLNNNVLSGDGDSDASSNSSSDTESSSSSWSELNKPGDYASAGAVSGRQTATKTTTMQSATVPSQNLVWGPPVFPQNGAPNRIAIDVPEVWESKLAQVNNVHEFPMKKKKKTFFGLGRKMIEPMYEWVDPRYVPSDRIDCKQSGNWQIPLEERPVSFEGEDEEEEVEYEEDEGEEVEVVENEAEEDDEEDDEEEEEEENEEEITTILYSSLRTEKSRDKHDHFLLVRVEDSITMLPVQAPSFSKVTVFEFKTRLQREFQPMVYPYMQQLRWMGKLLEDTKTLQESSCKEGMEVALTVACHESESLEVAMRLLRNREYLSACAILNTAANKGNIAATGYLMMCYSNGIGVLEDPCKAVYISRIFWKQVKPFVQANTVNAFELFCLAWRYIKAIGVRRDLHIAYFLLLKALKIEENFADCRYWFNRLKYEGNESVVFDHTIMTASDTNIAKELS